VVSLADVRSETDRVVRELAAKMPAAVAPPPEGVEHAYKMIADAARELFESLAAAVKGDERLRPDLVRAAHSVAMLVETGNDVLISKLTAPTPPKAAPPEAPKSDRHMSEAAE
jgi:acyl-CoA thioesterase